MKIDITYYLFAFFVFILVCIAIVLFKKIKNPNDVNDNTFHEKEKRLFKLYQNIEDMMTSAEEYMEEARNSIAVDKKEIQEIEYKVDELYKTIQLDIKNNKEYFESIKEEIPISNTNNVSTPIAKTQPVVKSQMSKNELVKYLHEEGLDTEEISKELGISKGEVELIIGLNR
jgi:hypothetical protein